MRARTSIKPVPVTSPNWTNCDQPGEPMSARRDGQRRGAGDRRRTRTAAEPRGSVTSRRANTIVDKIPLRCRRDTTDNVRRSVWRQGDLDVTCTATARAHARDSVGLRLPTWWACSAVSKYQPPGHTAHQTVYCWQPCLSGCCSSTLEQPARGRHLIVITAVFPASTKDSSFSTTIVSTPDSLTACQASLQWSL